MKLLWLILAVLPATLLGADTDFHVETDPEVYPPSAFAGKNVKTAALPSRIAREDALPDRALREKTFAGVPTLSDDVAKMDELDRDLLFVRARTRSLKELRKFYPQIAEKKLSRLQKEARAK